MNISTALRIPTVRARASSQPEPAPPSTPRDRVELAPLAHRKRLRPYVVGGLVLGAAVGAFGSLPGALFLGSLGAVVGLAVGSMLNPRSAG